MSLLKIGSVAPKVEPAMNFRISCQPAAAVNPKKSAMTKLRTTANFLIRWLSKSTDRPMSASGKTAIQEIFERIAKKKLVSKKIAAKIPTDENNAILATRDLIKICVWPISENHHQSVTKPIILEKSMKTTKSPVKEIRVRYFGIVIMLSFDRLRITLNYIEELNNNIVTNKKRYKKPHSKQDCNTYENRNGAC